MKNLLIISSLLLLGLNGFGQSDSIEQFKSDILGEWEYSYELVYDENFIQIDSISLDSLKWNVKLNFSKSGRIQKGWESIGNSLDGSWHSSSGAWSIDQNLTINKIWLHIDDNDVLFSGHYELISIKNDILKLKSCSNEYDVENCNVLYFSKNKEKIK